MATNYQGKKYRGWVDPEAELGDLIEDPSSLERRSDARLFLKRAGRHIFHLDVVYAKRPTPCLAYYAFGRSLGHGSARISVRRVLRYSEVLEREGFQGVPVLAAVWRRGFLSRSDGLVVMQEVPDVVELESWGRHRSRTHDRIAWEDPIAANLASTLARLHEKRLFHGDLKSRHILVRPGDTDQFIFADLEKMKRLGRSPGLALDLFAARDLIQLLSSIRDGHPESQVNNGFLEKYLAGRDLGSRRSNRLRAMVGLYGPGGRFRQGETVLRNLLGALRGKR